jgi:peptidoglycan hydrolase-like protein with peptidoglycan-binding domain
MTGHDVRVLQGYLSVAGYSTPITGDFESITLRQVKAFQRAHGFAANGVVTVPVEKQLRAVVAAIDAIPPTGRARINADGTATAPAGAPPIVQAVIAAANRIIDKPYIYAGGHASWNAPGYDCSGAVSYALHGAGLLSSPLAVGFEFYGSPGPGRWITVYADPSHVFMVVDGRAFDTADYGGPNIPGGTGPRWRYDPTGNLADGGDYVVRHPAGL